MELALTSAYKKNFGEYIKEQVKLQNWTMSEDKTKHIYCDCVFYFDRTDKDCNNYFKLLLIFYSKLIFVSFSYLEGYLSW